MWEPVMVTCLLSGDIGNYYYGQGHPMKPQRVRMAHNLLLNYGLYRKMEIYVSVHRHTHICGDSLVTTGSHPVIISYVKSPNNVFYL